MRLLAAFLLLMMLAVACTAQTSAPAPSADEVSGMYSFLRDGEFLQIAVEKDGSLTGVLSHYGDGESDREAFLSQFIRKGLYADGRLSFTTDVVHAVWWKFSGEAVRVAGKTPADEGFLLLRGRLTRHELQNDKSDKTRDFDVELKSLPVEAEG